MDARFEGELVELSAEGGYLMACAERKMLFFQGDEAGKAPLDELEGLEAAGDSLLLTLAGGRELRLRFAGAESAALAVHAERLREQLRAWS